MITTASAFLQLRTQFLQVLSRPVKTLNKPFESLQSAAEPRQGAFRHSHGWTLNICISISVLRLSDHTARIGTASTFLQIRQKEAAPWCPDSGSCHFQNTGATVSKWQQVVGNIGEAGGASSSNCSAFMQQLSRYLRF
jgi:hypothetical protein